MVQQEYLRFKNEYSSPSESCCSDATVSNIIVNVYGRGYSRIPYKYLNAYLRSDNCSIAKLCCRGKREKGKKEKKRKEKGKEQYLKTPPRRRRKTVKRK